MQRIFIFLFSLLLFQSALSSNFGTHITYPIIKMDPKNFYGYRAAVWYHPPSWVGNALSVYWDGSYGHWWTQDNIPYHSLSIISVAPTLRLYFFKNSTLSPFVNLSVGLSYLSKTHIANRYLGVHFAFQDEIGLGATFGPEQRFSLIASALHYSNGSLAHVNAGITVPLLVTLGYRF